MLVFFSPAGISALKKNFPDFDQKEIKIGTFGSTTAQAVRDAGFGCDTSTFLIFNVLKIYYQIII